MQIMMIGRNIFSLRKRLIVDFCEDKGLPIMNLQKFLSKSIIQ